MGIHTLCHERGREKRGEGESGGGVGRGASGERVEKQYIFFKRASVGRRLAVQCPSKGVNFFTILAALPGRFGQALSC